uniref:Protein kinase domain-containing protein n=1 Tax=Parastrongyloides trichosuri TaxID=131310 RepID=A0A0N4ZBD5_PARTI
MDTFKSTSSSLTELTSDDIVVVDEVDHYAEEWIPPFAFREGISLNKRQKIGDFYRFEEPLGEGKFGRVFKCIEKSTQLSLAAKCIKIKKDSELKQVENEISILTQMRHKCIAQIYDAYYTEKNFEKEVILIMEIVEGGELFDRVVEESYVLTELAIAMIIFQICEAIKYIHSNNFIHLDLKPENIMCVSQTSNQIKLIDFGLAQHYDGEQDLLFMAGTPEFAAPEVIKYEPLNFHTDMWSVGVITYILLSGQSPFLGSNIAITYNKVEKGDWSFCEEFDSNEISQDARDFISGLLIVKKENRMLPDKCLLHPWLTKAIEKAHNNKNKIVTSSDETPIDKEKLKRYLKNKKFRKIVFGVLFINQVLKMITTMQLKKNKKGLLYAKNLLQAAKKSEKSIDKEEDPQFLTNISISESNKSNEDKNKLTKKLKIKNFSNDLESKKIKEETLFAEALEEKSLKNKKVSIKKVTKKNVIEINKNNIITEVQPKKNILEITKKSSSLKENRNNLEDIKTSSPINIETIKGSLNISNLSTSKTLHSTNEKSNISTSTNICEKQMITTCKIDQKSSTSSNHTNVEAINVKNNIKNKTTFITKSNNTTICNQNNESIAINLSKKNSGEVLLKPNQFPSINNNKNNNNEDIKQRKNENMLLCSNPVKSDKEKSNVIEITLNKNEGVKKNNCNMEEKEKTERLNEIKETQSIKSSVKKIKKVVKKVNVKKEIENYDDKKEETIINQLPDDITSTNLIKKKTYNEMKTNDSLIQTTKSSNSSSLIKKTNINNKNSSANKKVLDSEAAVVIKPNKCKEPITCNIVKDNYDKNGKSVEPYKSFPESFKPFPHSESYTLPFNEELNKIERRNGIVKRKGNKSEQFDIMPDNCLVTLDVSLDSKNIIPNINNDDDNNPKRMLTNKKSLSIVNKKLVSHKTTLDKTIRTQSLKIKSNESTAVVQNSVTQLDHLPCEDTNDDNNFSFNKLKEMLEQRLSNKKSNILSNGDIIIESNNSTIKKKSELFECNGLSKVDFENVKNVKNKWLSIEKKSVQ